MRWIASIAGFGCAFLAASAAAEPVAREKVVAALPKLEALAQKEIDGGGVPGLAIAVIHNDEVVYLKGFGLREAGKPEKVDADTVFQIASLSKPVSATVVAALSARASSIGGLASAISTRPWR